MAKYNYEEKFDDIMEYVEMKVGGDQSEVKNEEQLRDLILSLDTKRRDKTSAPKLSDRFVQRLLQTRGARSLIADKGSVGRFGTTAPAKKAVANKPSREGYRYDGGSGRAELLSFSTVSRKGKRYEVSRFRDAKTKKFVGKSRIRTE